MTTSATTGPTLAQWLAGARPRTLPAAASPVLAGSALAYAVDRFAAGPALLALLVALALQVGVNYANDYSDGIRGTDRDRVGPLRLVGSGLAQPSAVKAAAFTSFAVAAVAGLVLVLLTGHEWLLAVGVLCVLAAWYYTGGRRPYGYAGLGELAVFVFFGLVAVCGTTYVQAGTVSAATVLTGAWVGALACAILVANNLRDLRGDAEAGKRTLATRLGDPGTRRLYLDLVVTAGMLIAAVAALTSAWALLGLLGLTLAIPACRQVRAGASGPALVAVLRSTGTTELAAAALFTLGLVISRL